MLNKITLIGRIGGQPEKVTTQGGSVFYKVTMATNERYQKQGEWQEKTTWHNLQCWDSAQGYNPLAKRFTGDLVYVEGQQQNDSYTGNDGVKKHSSVVKVTLCKSLQSSAKHEPPMTVSDVEDPKDLPW